MSEDAENIIGLYERHAAVWDRLRGQGEAPSHWLAKFVSAMPEGANVLDLGCGAGVPMAGALIAKGCVITGVDSSPSLIAVARERFPEAEWIVADMRRLSLGRRFDGVLAWHSSFHLTKADQTELFPLLAAHLRPGGALIFTSGDADGIAIGEFEGEPLFHDSLSPGAYRDLLAQNGFELIDHIANDADTGRATVWLARRK